MSVKASVSLTEAQDAYARKLVAQGHYPSVSAVVQRGIELLREQSETADALRELVEQRRAGRFISAEKGRQRTQAMIARKRTERGL